MLGELMAVVGTFNQTNRLADGYQVEVDPQLMSATENGGVAVSKTKPAKAKKASGGKGKARAAKGIRA
jgi:hypothetical protein